MKSVAALAAVALSVSILGVTTPASASPGCVAKGEFDAAKRGALKVNVHNNFDTAGTRDSISYYNSGGYTHKDEYREYRMCAGGSYSYVSLNFDNYSFRDSKGPGMRLYSKSWYRG